jgi:mono/diheme cytochrome c family protein
MMKNIWIVTLVAATGMLISCNGVRREPGRAYMPDMSYSRAYETYASTENLKEQGINYTALPVAGTFAQHDPLFVYPYKNDSAGYANSVNVKSPLPQMDTIQYLEAARIYLVNCGICHGPKLDGNGPLWNGGNGPFPSAPRNLMSPEMVKLADGTMFHTMTYGKNAMGSYASQLNTNQRWMVIQYIRDKQAKGAVAPADSTAKGKTPMTDTTKKVK